MEKKEVLNQTIQKTKEDSKLIEDLVFNIVVEYTKPLDDIMRICREIFNSKDQITLPELEDLLAQLPSTLYFVNEGLERVGIKEDIAKMVKTEAYSKARDKATGTVADKNTVAELATLNEAITHIIYQRSYKMIRSKIEMGQEMINSLKRIFDAKMNDYNLSRGGR